jgi:hypothetical protein
MTNEELADVLIDRLNDLTKDLGVRTDVGTLIEARVKVSQETADHPALQVSQEGPIGPWHLGVLGLMNGLCGVIPEGPKKGWGYITAVIDDNGFLESFKRTDQPQTSEETSSQGATEDPPTS